MIRPALLASVAALAAASTASAQFFIPAVPPGPGIGFSFSGKRIAVQGFIGGGWFGPVPYFAPVPQFGWGGWGPPPVVIVQPPPVVVVRNPDRDAARLPDDDPPPPKVDRAAAEARVNEAVERGQLLVIRPQAPGAVPVARIPDPPKKVDGPKPGAKLPPVTLDPPRPPADPKARAAFRIEMARAAFAAEFYGRAADHLRDAIADAPDETLAYFLLAQCHTARGEYAEAVTAIRDGMRKAPDWPKSKFRIGELYGRNGERFVAHLADLRAAAEANPDDAAAQFLYAYHLWFIGERQSAVRRLKALSPKVKDNGVIERFLLDADGKDI